jgi:predicted negative regulator of RcsB-dependent stress response
MLSFVFASVFVLGMASWNKSQSHEKQLFTEIWQDIRKELQSDRSMKLKHAARTLWARSGRNGGSET